MSRSEVGEETDWLALRKRFLVPIVLLASIAISNIILILQKCQKKTERHNNAVEVINTSVHELKAKRT